MAPARISVSDFPEVEGLLKSNQAWSKEVGEREKGFFERCAAGQAPPYLWFGCCDSRVPETVVLDQKPGALFVHRNIANQYQLDDDSANAVLEYGLMTVGCQHILVVGHSACGGCLAVHEAATNAATNPDQSPPPSTSIDAADKGNASLYRWLDPLIKLNDGLPEGHTVDDLIEENVRASVRNMIQSPTLLKAWEKANKGEMKRIYVHGWVYDLATGHLRDLDISHGPETLAATKVEGGAVHSQEQEQTMQVQGKAVLA